jgi:uncharacterized repeat protein (TIGR03803 family)
MKKTNAFLLATCLFLAFNSRSISQTPLLYGVTYNGGTNFGTIYTFNTTTNRDSVLWDFGSGSDGYGPEGELIYNAGRQLFYATTGFGGSKGYGSIISFNPFTKVESVSWSFSGTDGATPVGNLVYDANNGLYYGLTSGGGAYDSGTIISFNPSTNTVIALWSLGHMMDGGLPYGSLIYDLGTGKYYGTTSHGGTYGSGVIFSYDPSSNIEKVVWNFGAYLDGQNPNRDLAYDPINGLYYGTLQNGGSYHAGSVFSFNTSTNNENVVWDFYGDLNDGLNPFGSLVYYPANGLFYGTTEIGGARGSKGTIFSFNPITNRDSVLWNFAGNPTDGASPFCDLVYYPTNGLFYGVTNQGGDNFGTIFSFNPTNNTEKMVWAFKYNGIDGRYPYQGLVVYDTAVLGTQEITHSSSVNVYPSPNNGLLTVSLQNINDKTQILVYNTLGELVCYNMLNATNTQIDLSSNAPGIYLYRVLTETGTLVSDGKFVIQK